MKKILTSEILERKNRCYAESLKNKGNYPAAVIGAEFSRYKRLAKSGPVSATKLVKILRNKLSLIGGLYTKANKNTIGCCAEVNSANEVLIFTPHINLNQIRFSKAIRPRTMQVVPRCHNCNITFN